MDGTRRNGEWTGGALLIVIGVLLLAVQFFPISGAFVLGGIGAVFLIAYAGTRRAGFLIPAFILGGLAVGVGLEEAGYGGNGSTVVLGLAGGFLSIYVAYAVLGIADHWWPLIPGGILAVTGASQLATRSDAQAIVRWWPIVLIAIGVAVLFGYRRAGAPRAAP